MQFHEVIGHEREKQTLLELVEQNRLPHALLFTNSKGNGAFPLAFALASYLLCSDRQENNSCGACNSCVAAQGLAHPDLFFTFPVFNKSKDTANPSTSNDFISDFKDFINQRPYADASTWIQSLTNENKQGNIPANECNNLLRKMNLRPLLGGAKISIIWYAEFLGTNGNKLLKMIEEPPKNTYIFLIAEEPDKILQTIQSRAQLFALKPYSTQQIGEALVQRGIAEERAMELALMANGNFDEASQLQNLNDINYYEFLRTWLNAIYTKNAAALHNWSLQLETLPKEKSKGFYQYAAQVLAQVTRLEYMSAEQLPLSAKEKNLVSGLKKQGLNAYRAEQFNALLEKSIYHIERNVYKKLVIYNCSVRAQDILLD